MEALDLDTYARFLECLDNIRSNTTMPKSPVPVPELLVRLHAARAELRLAPATVEVDCGWVRVKIHDSPYAPQPMRRHQLLRDVEQLEARITHQRERARQDAQEAAERFDWACRGGYTGRLIISLSGSL